MLAYQIFTKWVFVLHLGAEHDAEYTCNLCKYIYICYNA